jgi:hypothetical protein
LRAAFQLRRGHFLENTTEIKMPNDAKPLVIQKWAMEQLSYYFPARNEKANRLYRDIEKAFLDIRTEYAERILELEERISDLESKLKGQS